VHLSYAVILVACSTVPCNVCGVIGFYFATTMTSIHLCRKQRLMPYFIRQNNDDLILSIQSAGVERGRNGFRKNKSMEKQPESEEDLLEHRTDGTDAFETLYIGCEKFPQYDLYPIAIGGVR